MTLNRETLTIPLSSRSLAFLALYYANDRRCNSCDLVFIEGEISRKKLTQAIHAVVNHHPILQCKVVRKLGNLYWQKTDVSPSIEFIDESSRFATKKLWKEAIHSRVDTISLDPFEEAPIKIIVSTFHGESSIEFYSHHLISDARSGFRFFMHLDLALKGEELPKDLSFRRERDLFVSLNLRDYIAALRELARELLTPVKKIANGHFNRNFTYQVMPKDLLDDICLYAKNKGVSVNSVLSHCLYKIFGEKITYETISLRSYSKVRLDGAYNNLILPFSSSLHASMEDHYRKIKEITSKGPRIAWAKQNILTSSIKFMPGFLIGPLTKLVQTLFYKGNIIISNLGHLPSDLSTLGEAKVLDFYDYTTALPPAEVAVVWSTFRGRLRFSLASKGTDSSQLAGAMTRELESLVQGERP